MKFVNIIFLAIFCPVAQGSPYTIITDSLEITHNNPTYGLITSHVQNGGTTSAKMNVNVTLHKNFPSNAMMQVSAKKFTNDEFTLVGVPILKTYCAYAKEDRMLYPGFVKSGNFPTSCPVRKGSYYMKDYVVDVDRFPPVMPSGKFQVTLLVSTVGKAMFNIVWTGDVIAN